MLSFVPVSSTSTLPVPAKSAVLEPAIVTLRGTSGQPDLHAAGNAGQDIERAGAAEYRGCAASQCDIAGTGSEADMRAVAGAGDVVGAAASKDDGVRPGGRYDVDPATARDRLAGAGCRDRVIVVVAGDLISHAGHGRADVARVLGDGDGGRIDDGGGTDTAPNARIRRAVDCYGGNAVHDDDVVRRTSRPCRYRIVAAAVDDEFIETGGVGRRRRRRHAGRRGRDIERARRACRCQGRGNLLGELEIDRAGKVLGNG